ncbi:MAG: amino acid racemase [Clostridia bacterium]|nr:amino acid racemase [Clostridia bacterium]
MGMLGIIGGMGPAATDLLYRRIIDRTDAECDQEHLDMVILNHASMPDRTAAIKSGDTDKVLSLLIKDAKFLTAAGAAAIAIPCNTSHYFYDELQEQTEIPIINMVRETARFVREKGRKKVCVLATDGTIMTGIYEKALSAEGVEYLAPDENTQKLVMKIIYEQVKKGFPGNEEDFREIHHFIKANGCDGAILACTELSVFREEAGLTNFYTDALEVLCEKSILYCGKQLREMV